MNKIPQVHYPVVKSHQLSLKNQQESTFTQQASETITLRKESINNLTRSLLQRESLDNNFQIHENSQLKNPKITKMINLAQKITSIKKKNQVPSKNFQFQKLEQLKNRYKKIKISYEQNHKIINSNISNCLLNYKERCTLKQNNSNVNAFQILKEDLTFSQSRDLNPNELMGQQNHNREISFRNEMNSMDDITVKPYEKNKENQISSANKSLSRSSNQEKYKSLSKELQSMRHGELVELLIEEIQDNEKNKHMIMQQTKIINSQKKETEQKYQKISKLKDEIQDKRQQIQSKRQQMQILLETERKNLQIIQKLKRQLQQVLRNQQKSFFFQHSQIQKAFCKDICIKNSQDSSKIFAQKQDQESLVDYKLRHDQLKKYMNEYINNVNEAYEEYKRNLQELKDSNYALKQQNISLTQQIQQTHNSKKSIENQLLKLSKQFQKLSHALGNSKGVIKQLEQEFLILKEQNTQMKMILQRQGPELIQMKNSNQLMIIDIDNLIGDNQNLRHKNLILNQEIAQIQMRMLENSQIQTQVRNMISGLTQQKSNLQQQVQKQIQDYDKLIKQLKINEQTKSALKQAEKTQLVKRKTFQAKIKTLQQTIYELNTQISMLQRKNSILEQTNQEMQKLQEDLLLEYECEKDQKLKLRSELIQIMNHVKQMQAVYVKELSSNQLIKIELSKFWQNRQNKSTTIHTKNNHHSQPNSREDKLRIFVNQLNKAHLKSQNSAQNMSNSEVSYKKNSQMTKEGSSYTLRQNIITDQLCINSKVSEHQNNRINASSIVDGSRISEKYYSQTDEDVQLELQILKSSKKTNPNMNIENYQDKIRINERAGSIKSKENR